MNELTYSEILEHNQALSNDMVSPPYTISLLSNTTVHQLKEILEYTLRSKGVNAVVTPREYDNIVQDSLKHNDENSVIIFYDLVNITENFYYNAELLNEKEIESILTKVKSEIDFILTNLKDTPLVLFNLFSPALFTHQQISDPSKLTRFCNGLNQYLRSLQNPNLKLIDIEKIFMEVSISKAVDFRYFYSSMMLYSIDFHIAYSQYIRPLYLALEGRAKKVLIVDCDNTLWEGILAEDGFDQIQLSAQTAKGKIFNEVQSLIKSLAEKGILICLCSKNNPEDVDSVLLKHENMVLRDDDIIIKKVNWDDKVGNVRAIASELNIGLDNVVFIDDSDFEIHAVQDLLPEVNCFKVPKKLYQYPALMRYVSTLFHTLSLSDEDLERTRMYKEQEKRITSKSTFDTMDDYLASLNLELHISLNNTADSARLSQLTQKTNQFNFTTKRYNESEMISFIERDEYLVFSVRGKDKFGDSGLSALAILEIDGDSAAIDSFLMSCRILGRKLEQAFFMHIIETLKKHAVKTVNSSYIKTAKNAQVSTFYDKANMNIEKQEEGLKIYTADIDEITHIATPYITLFDE